MRPVRHRAAVLISLVVTGLALGVAAGPLPAGATAGELAPMARTDGGLGDLSGLVGRYVPPAGARDTPPVALPANPRGLRPPVGLPRRLDAEPGYEGQRSCRGTAMPGAERLRRLVLATYGEGHDGGITRDCTVGGLSEHKEGRAWDWMVDVGDARERAAAADFLAWLTAERRGVAGAMARRLGVMYVIYNRRIWSAYSSGDGWRAYTGASPHTDHVHVSLSWSGAYARTSFWTGRVSAPVVEPCIRFEGGLGSTLLKPRTRPCAAPVPMIKRTNLYTQVVGSAGLVVTNAQKYLGLTADGRFGTATWLAVRRYQAYRGLPVTGSLDQPTLSSMFPGYITYDAVEGLRPAAAARAGLRDHGDEVLRPRRAGRPVAVLQTALEMGPRWRTGVYGSRTVLRVNEVRAALGLARNGRTDRAVWAALVRRTGA